MAVATASELGFRQSLTLRRGQRTKILPLLCRLGPDEDVICECADIVLAGNRRVDYLQNPRFRLAGNRADIEQAASTPNPRLVITDEAQTQVVDLGYEMEL